METCNIGHTVNANKVLGPEYASNETNTHNPPPSVCVQYSHTPTPQVCRHLLYTTSVLTSERDFFSSSVSFTTEQFVKYFGQKLCARAHTRAVVENDQAWLTDGSRSCSLAADYTANR